MTEQSKSTKPFELEKAGNIFYFLLPVFDLVRANGHNLYMKHLPGPARSKHNQGRPRKDIRGCLQDFKNSKSI